jgi:hypothetical protein
MLLFFNQSPAIVAPPLPFQPMVVSGRASAPATEQGKSAAAIQVSGQ